MKYNTLLTNVDLREHYQIKDRHEKIKIKAVIVIIIFKAQE